METNLIKIGNSKGVRIPKSLIEMCHLDQKLQFIVTENGLLLSPKIENEKKDIRVDWAGAMREMHLNGDDKLLIPDVFEDENFEDWTW